MACPCASPDPRVIRTGESSPRFWQDRSVIFVANLLSLFFGNRDGSRILESEISCVDSYGGRLLPVLGLLFGGHHNVLLLERQPDPALTRYFTTLGLSLPSIEILTRAEFLALGEQLESHPNTQHPLLDRLRNQPASTLDGFVTDRTVSRLASALNKDTLSTAEGSHRGNNKLLLHQHLKSIGTPVFPTTLAASDHEIAPALSDFHSQGYSSAVIKSQIGASGIGLRKTATDSPPSDLSPAFFHEGPCMVQAWLKPGEHGVAAIHSPSVQIFVNHDSVTLYDLTEQILDPEESVHQGNESPPSYLSQLPDLAEELFHQAGLAASWLHRQGYRGTASADFLVTTDAHGSFTAYVCEINARVTGATYPSVLARHFRPHGCWRMRNLELRTTVPGNLLLDKLTRHSELFDPARRTGILPINFNLDPDGLVRKGQFLAIANTLPACRQLLKTARRDLPVDWDYTKDR